MFKRLFLALCFLIVSALPARAAIQFDVWVGYDSVIRDAAWFPVAIEVYNDGATFNGVIEISSSQFGREPDRVIPVELPTNTRKRIVVPMFASGGRTSGNWDARLLDKSGKTRAERQGIQTRTVSWQGLMIGALPRAFAGMPTLPKLKINQQEMQPAVARFQTEQFPDSPIALEGLDALYVSSEKIISLPQPQLEALLAWVRGGGHLILGIEQLGDVTSTPWLAQFLPVEVSTVENRDVDVGLATWLRSDLSADEAEEVSTGRVRTGRRRTSGNDNFYSSLTPDSAFAGAQMPVAAGRVRDGRVIIGTDAAPLAVQTTRGRGRLTTLLFSPEREPFKSWSLRPYFWGRLVQMPTVWLTSPDFSNYGAWSMDGVFGALIDSRQVKKLPVEWLLLLLLVYLIVIGPFDQWWLKKINRQMLTWITFPCYVIFFSLLIYFIGYKLRAGETEWNEVQVVDVFPRGDKADLRGRGFVSVYSSSNARYALAAEPSHSMIRPEFIDTYGTSRETKMRIEQNGNAFKGEIFVPVWTSLLVVNDWFKTDERPLNASVSLESNGSHSVRIQNPNSRKLTDVRVVVGGMMYELGAVDAGADISKQLNPASGTPIEEFVQRKGSGFQTAVDQRRNPLGHESGRLDNRPETVAAASFFRMLESNLQANRAIVAPAGLDMSAEVRRGDAVVLAWDAGQIPVKPINQFKPIRMQRDTMLRLVVPVKRS